MEWLIYIHCSIYIYNTFLILQIGTQIRKLILTTSQNRIIYVFACRSRNIPSHGDVPSVGEGVMLSAQGVENRGIFALSHMQWYKDSICPVSSELPSRLVDSSDMQGDNYYRSSFSRLLWHERRYWGCMQTWILTDFMVCHAEHRWCRHIYISMSTVQYCLYVYMYL
jgi:hypothetical protein